MENSAGLVIDDYQLGLLAPLMASHLGVVVARNPAGAFILPPCRAV